MSAPADKLRPEPGSPPARPWHALPASDVTAAFGTPADGLSGAEAAARQRTFGPNILPQPPPPGLLAIYLGQFRSPFIYLLLAAAAVSLAIGEVLDAAFIFAILQINAAIGTFQEWKARSEAEQLRNLIPVWAVVRRGGGRDRIPAEDLVPGDLVSVEGGLLVPADIRLLEARDLEIDESMLTGESTPVAKNSGASLAAETVAASRITMMHAGTVVSRGRGSGVVTAIGAATQIGQIAAAVSATGEVPPPLLVRMRRFARAVSVVIAVVIVLLGVIEFTRGIPVAEIFLVAAAFAVAAIPEGLPVALTVALSVAVRRMARRNVIVRLLPAVEGLGSCTVIASDKTGTLTRNELSVRHLAAPGGIGCGRCGCWRHRLRPDKSRKRRCRCGAGLAQDFGSLQRGDAPDRPIWRGQAVRR